MSNGVLISEKRLLCVFAFNQSFHWFIVGLLIPVLSLLQLEKGLDLFQIGISLALYSGTIILLELPTGGLADAIGRKRLYLLSLGTYFLALSTLLIAWDFISVVYGFFLMGVARALSSGSMDAWFVDEFNRINPEGNLQKAFAFVGVFIPFGLGLGSFLGGLLPMSLGALTSQIPGFGIYSANLIAGIALSVVQFTLTMILIVERPLAQQNRSLLSGFRQLPNVLSTSVKYGVKHPLVFMLLCTSIAWGLGISGLEAFWQPQVKDILGSDSETWIFGLLAAGYFFASSMGSLIITPICRVFGNNYPLVLFIVRFLMGASFFILALQTNLPGFAIFYLTLFLFNGMSNSPHASIFNSHVPSEKRSTLLSFESLFLQIGGLIGTLLMGYLSNEISISIAWFVGAGILSVSSLIYLFLPVVARGIGRSQEVS